MFYIFTFEKIQSSAFKTEKSNKQFYITFYLTNFTKDAFEPGTFDGIQRPTTIHFYGVNLSYLDQSVFKSFLQQNKQNNVKIENFKFNGGYIHCEDCRNQ